MAGESDPIVEMFDVDETQRNVPEAELNTEAPPDKPDQERDETGKFKGKEEAKEPAKEVKAEEPKKEPKGEEKRDETVPLAKYLREKGELKEQLAQRDITLKQYEQRLAALEAKANPPPAEPDFIENPKEYVDHKVQAALKGIEEANKKADESGKKAQEIAAQNEQQAQMQRIMGVVKNHEAQFVAANPDYYDALTHIRNVRMFQLQELQPGITQEQINETITREETMLAAQLVMQGRNPSEVAYKLAHQYGYQKKAADPAKQNGQKLPEPPVRQQLPPDQTLGSGSSEESPVYREDEVDPVDLALGSLKRTGRAA